MKKFFLIGTVLLCYACNNDDDQTQDPVFCTEELRAGLEVTVKDGIAGEFLTEGVTVVAIDNEYKETLENFTGANNFIGAFERAGTYIITVSKNGYTNKTSEPIVVGEDICHVITESLEVILEKQ
ncbi:hypothetical protein [Aquimarina celericrescens]|uniref:Carboxypeptidase regulatory-like domain-containing protein n=1 Tax=Aquimarina celericrescens TaxID=1964542 RepID=A0ABW5AV43_9FLAO|nr:hypothetical protein [Aquimarina celericrescens]